uniref:NADH-ubiquinone oxidoreductase chain 4 n=1 Tax=Angiostrongylus cantonensis TaxID=6313 RepID=A0A0K0DRN6_ANGCA
MGLFIYVDSNVFVLLVLMMVFIYGVVVIREFSRSIKNIMMLYMFFELSIFPILVMILGFGSQIEKIGSRDNVYFIFKFYAHVEAPTTARILLAGLLLKLGTAGFLRILGSINFSYNNFWLFLSLLGIVLSAFRCLFQRDSKSLAAYSSVTHIRFLLLAIRVLFIRGKVARILMILAHGYTSTLMFYLIGEFFHVRSRRI